MNSESKRAIGVIIGLAIFTALSVIFIAPHDKQARFLKVMRWL